MIKINKEKFRIAVLAGGFEPEHYASMLTGKNIYKALKKAGYKKVKLIEVNSKVSQKIKKYKPEFAYIALFCKWGEDGVLPGFLEVLGIPYSGSGVEACCLSKNKYNLYSLAKSININAPKIYFYGDKLDWKNQNKLLKITYPAIVKPSYQGYSLGVSLVENNNDINLAVKNAYKFSRLITIEEYIDGPEYTVGVLETAENTYLVLPIIEIKFKKTKIQDTETKDKPHLIEEIIHERLPNEIKQQLETTAINLFKLAGCVGVSRFDFRINKDGAVVLLENNTCPGLLSYQHSDLPKQLKYVGMEMEEFVELMIQSGLRRKDNKLEIKYN